MQKVLFIACHFPPIGGSGVQRPTKFVKYLPQFGWQSYVISADRPYSSEQGWDETLLADIPNDVQVWRVPTPRPQPVNRLARWVGWQAAPAQGGDGKADVSDCSVIAPSRPSLAKRLRRALLSPLYLVQNPLVDQSLYWSLRIVPLARRIIKQENIDVVFTTVPPWSALLTGLFLQKLTGCPWVADFRDPWTDNTFIYFPSNGRRRLDERLERALIRRADAVISVTDPCLQGLAAKVDANGRNKPFVLIPNGWDRDDFSGGGKDWPSAKQRDGDHEVILLHPGSAYQGEPLPILNALERLSAHEEALARLRFHFVGYMHPADQARIAGSPHSSLFRLEGQRVPHPDAIRLMKDSHVLLLLLRKGPDASSGKIFEYMVAGRPVLAIASGVAAELVHQCGIGCVVHPDNVDRLALVLREIAQNYEDFVAEYYHPNWSVINQYERRALTKRLAQVLDKIVTPGIGYG